MADANQQLHQAYELIKAGQKQEATRILLEVLKADRNNADAWWLLANATGDAQKKRQALEQVLRVQPEHGAARRALDNLTGNATPAASTFRELLDDPFTPPSTSAPAPRSSTIGKTSGDPFSQSATPRRASTLDDPFSDPFSQPAASAPRKPATTVDVYAGDPFAGNQPFTEVQQRRLASPPVQRKGTNPLVTCLAIIGGLTVLCCGIGAIALIGFGASVRDVVATAISDPTVQAAIATFNDPTMQAFIRNPSNQPDLIEKGRIDFGQTVRASLEDSGAIFHAYTFTGESGRKVIIELTAINNAFDTILVLVGPDQETVAENDDIGSGNRNSRIEANLGDNGTYMIVVGDFGSDGGEYELTLR